VGAGSLPADKAAGSSSRDSSRHICSLKPLHAPAGELAQVGWFKRSAAAPRGPWWPVRQPPRRARFPGRSDTVGKTGARARSKFLLGWGADRRAHAAPWRFSASNLRGPASASKTASSMARLPASKHVRSRSMLSTILRSSRKPCATSRLRCLASRVREQVGAGQMASRSAAAGNFPDHSTGGQPQSRVDAGFVGGRFAGFAGLERVATARIPSIRNRWRRAE